MIMNLNCTDNNFLFVEVDNPFLVKTTESGLDVSGGVAFSADSGEIELSNKIVGTGIVSQIGPECKYINVGDLVFYDRRGPRPIIGKDNVYWILNELSVLTYVHNGEY